MISSFFGDQVPSLYLVPSTLDLLRLCFCLVEGVLRMDSSAMDFRWRWDGGLAGPFVAPADLVLGGIGLGGCKEVFWFIFPGI